MCNPQKMALFKYLTRSTQYSERISNLQNVTRLVEATLDLPRHPDIARLLLLYTIHSSTPQTL